MIDLSGQVIAVSRAAEYMFSKPVQDSIQLVEGLGVEGDAHNGKTVKHRHRMKKDPTVPNLRQVHLIHTELLEELRPQGFDLLPGQIGENITTQGIDLLGLPTGTQLKIGEARIEVTGLRNPCYQLNDFKAGLMQATLDKAADGKLIVKAGIMGIVLAGGEIRAGDAISVELPPKPHHPLEIV